MRVTEFISQHLDKNLVEKPEIKGECKCKMCGAKSDSGISDMITKTFTDYAFLQFPAEKLVCKNCAACLGKVISPHNGKPTFFRNFSFLATEDSLKLLKRDDIMNIMLNPPHGQFVLAVTYSNKKHISFKSRIQSDRDRFIVFTDTGEVPILRDKLQRIVSVLQPLYTICKDTKQTPTWFSKTDILTGCRNNKKIEEYGLRKYFDAEERIRMWRGTTWLKLIVFALNKGDME